MYPAVIFLLAGNPCRGEPLNIKGKHSFSGQDFVNQGVAEADWEWQVQHGGGGSQGEKMGAQREVCYNCRKFKSGDTVGNHEGFESRAIHRKR